MRAALAALLLLTGGSLARSGAGASASPARIVSMNLCADELVLRLADRAQVASVSWLARDPRGSTVAQEAAGVPLNRGLAEEIVALQPDLVIAGAFTNRGTVAILKRIGLPVRTLSLPQDFAGVRAQIREVASAVGQSEHGEAMARDLDARLAAVAPPGEGPRPRVLVLRPNAFTVAPGTLGDAILQAAGLVNAGAEIGQDRLGQVPLEALVLADPDLVVLDEAERGRPSLADALLHHPILARYRREGRTVSIPNRLWTCPGPQIAEVVERLAAARNSIKKRAANASPRWGEDRDDPVVVAVGPQGEGEWTRPSKGGASQPPHHRLPPRFGDDEVAEALSPPGRGNARQSASVSR